MKKHICLGFAGILLVSIMILAGCPNPASSDPEPGGNLGDIDLVLSGEVYEAKASGNSGYTYTGTTKTGKISASPYSLFAEGELKDGSFSITIPKPDPVYLDDLDWNLKRYSFSHWKNVKAEPGNVKVCWLSLNLDDSSSSELSRAEASYRKNGSIETGGSFTGDESTVSYIYVDKNVTITGGTAASTEYFGPIKLSSTYNGFSLELKKGWNAIVLEENESGSSSGSGLTGKSEYSYRVGNPDYRWILGGFPDFD
jgi:hypothetical protein